MGWLLPIACLDVVAGTGCIFWFWRSLHWAGAKSIQPMENWRLRLQRRGGRPGVDSHSMKALEFFHMYCAVLVISAPNLCCPLAPCPAYLSTSPFHRFSLTSPPSQLPQHTPQPPNPPLQFLYLILLLLNRPLHIRQRRDCGLCLLDLELDGYSGLG